MNAPQITEGNTNTYDFSGITGSTDITNEFVATTNSSATIDMQSLGAVTSYSYTNSSATIKKVVINGNITEAYSNAVNFLEFPVDNNLNFQDDYAFTVSIPQAPAISTTGNLEVKYNGSGTLITAKGTYNDVVCIARKDIRTTVQGGNSSTLTIIDHLFYKAGIHVPIARLAFQQSSSGTGTSFTYLTEDNLHVNTLDASTINITPNPASDVIKISGNQEIEAVQLIDLNGKIVKITFDKQSATIDISSLVPGIYQAKIYSNNGVAFKKIVKQ